jgi:aldehyde dehydrogenase (NAD+)
MTATTARAVRLHIGGERRSAGSGGVHQHVNPATGLPDSEVPLAGPDEVDEAVRVAQEAFASWRATRPAQRRDLLLRLADLIEQHTEEITHLGALDNGTPVSVTALFPARAAEWVRYYAGWADKIAGDTHASPASTGELAYTLAQPEGGRAGIDEFLQFKTVAIA